MIKPKRVFSVLEPPKSSDVLGQPIRLKETFQQPVRIKQSVGILAITGSKNKHTIANGPLDQGGIGLHASAFKKFVHFFRNSFFPVTKCVSLIYHSTLGILAFLI